jgi:hypothetical protein
MRPVADPLVTVRTYDPMRRLTVVVAYRGESHYTDGHGRLLCAPVVRVAGGQTTLDGEASCGWCRLITRNTLGSPR